MKTMRSIDGKRVFRVTNEKAAELYAEGSANYTSKEEWKSEDANFQINGLLDWLQLKDR